MAQNYFYPPSGGSGSNLSVGPNNTPIPADSTLIGGKDGSGVLRPVSVDSSGNVNSNVVSSVLPTGGATAANQVLEINDLDQIVTNTTGLALDATLSALSAKIPATLGQDTSANSLTVVIASDQSTVPVSVASLPLPSGAATSANQDTEIASLSSIDSKLSSPLPLPPDAATASNQVTQNASLASIDSKLTAPLAISASALPLPTGASTSANQTSEINLLTARLTGSLVPAAYDEIDLTYVPSGNGAGQIATAVYKLLTVTVKTLTLTYDSSNRVSTVVAT